MVNREDMNEDGNIRLSREDANFFDRIAKLPEESTQNLIKQKYTLQKCNNEKDLKYKLKEMRRIVSPTEKVDLKDYGITYEVSNNSLYKEKEGEEIYLSDEDGKIYTYDKYPGRTLPLKKFTNVILIIDNTKLKERLKDLEKAQQVIDVATNRRSSRYRFTIDMSQ